MTPLPPGIESYNSALNCPHDIGQKASRLAILQDLGYEVPVGVIVPFALVDIWCRTEANGRLIEDLMCQMAIDRHPVDFTTATQRMHLLREDAIPAVRDGASAVLGAVDALGIAPGSSIIVRSSASAEDGPGLTGAGLFSSVVCTASVDAIATAVATVWASLYSPEALIYCQRKAIDPASLRMSVVVQELVEFDLGGVAFTADPERGAGVGRADVSFAGPAAVVGGLAADITEHHVWGSENGRSKFADLWALLEELRQQFDAELDVEFGVRAGKVIVLQARPVAVPPLSAAPGVYTVDDVQRLGAEAFASSRVARVIRTRDTMLRAAAERGGLANAIVRVVVGSGADIDSAAFADLPGSFPSRRVLIDVSETLSYRVVERGRLLDELRDTIFLADEPIALVVSEFVEADYGVAAQCVGDTVVVETCPGSCGGITRGILSPSRYVLRSDGSLVSVELAPVGPGMFYDPSVKRPARREGRPPATLTTDQLVRVAETTKALTYSLGSGTILEAEGVGSTIYLLDCSSSDVADAPHGVLSQGSVSGTAVVISEDYDLAHVASSFAVSVASRESRAETLVSRVLVELDDARRRHPDTPVICVAKSPSAGFAYAIHAADGFIFEEGSPLCHLAILLREAGVPAVVMPGAVAKLANGVTVTISGAAVAV